MSAIGTKRTSLVALHMSAFGKADMPVCTANAGNSHFVTIPVIKLKADLNPKDFSVIGIQIGFQLDQGMVREM